MKVVVGLGNPGKKYKQTMHNIGFSVVEEIARRYIVDKEEYKFDGVIGHTRIDGEKIMLVKPLTYMNLSGQSVQPLVHYFKVDLSDLLVVYDDMDINPGNIKLKPSGGSGGHKGMKSIMERLGSNDFPRLRVGIGRPGGGFDVVGWVLSHPGQEERELMEKSITRAADAVECWIKDGIDKAMNQYN